MEQKEGIVEVSMEEDIAVDIATVHTGDISLGIILQM